MADYTPYDDKELEALKRDIVKLDVNVEQYDKQIQRCTDAIREFEDNIQKIKTEMLVNQHAPKKVQDELIRRHNEEKDKLDYENEKLNRLTAGRERTTKKYTEKSETLERITGEPTDKAALKDEVYRKQQERYHKQQEKSQEKIQKEKVALYSKRVNDILGFVKAVSSIAREFYQTSIDIQVNQMETLTKVTVEGMRAMGKGVNASLSSSLKTITDGVQEAAYASASAALDTSTALQEYQMNRDLGLMKMENYREVRTAKAVASGIQTGAAALGAAIGSVVTPGIGTAIGGAIGWAIGELGQWNAATTEGQARIEEEKLQQLNELKRTALEQGTSITNEINAFSNQVETLLGKNQAAAKNIQATMGMNPSAMSTSEARLFAMQQQIGVRSKNGRWQHLDVGLEDMDRMQTAYSQATGRGIAFNISDYNKQAQLGNVLGSQDLAVQLAAGMEIFNKSAKEGSDILWEMYKTANRMGIDARKYSKDLVKNMKLAEKYSFKGGVKGLMQMAAWAQKIGFNMDSLDGSLQKISEGGLEGVIKMGAEFQVLGGHAAMNADPLAMLYERYSDPEAFGKRMHDMLKGLGSFNKETGEVDVAGGNLMMAEQIAKVRGVSTEDVLNEIKREEKRNEIDKVLSPGQYNEQQRNLLASKATYNIEKGIWEVTGADHQKHNINNLSDADFESMAISHDETLETYVYDILSEVKKMNGTKMEGQQETMSRVRAEWEAQVEARMEEDKRFYEDSSGTLKGLITTSMQFATDMNKQQHETFLKSPELFNEVNEVILGNAREFAKSIADANSILRTAIRSLVTGATLSDNAKVILGLKTAEEVAAETKTKTQYDKLNEVYNRQEGYWGNFSKGQDVANERAKYYSTQGDEQFVKGDSLGGAWSKIKAGVMQTVGKAAQLIGNFFGADAASVDDFIHDGVVSANGKPMYSQAEVVTPIHDGSLQMAKSDPKDVALFAKTGGPFDTLFNGVFNRINKMYDAFKPLQSQNMRGDRKMLIKSLADVQGISDEDTMPMVKPMPMKKTSTTVKELWNNIQHDTRENITSPSAFNKPFDINFHGEIILKSENGQTFDISRELQTNPMLLRSLSRMLAQQISSAMNGGRGTLPMEIGSV